MVANLGEKITKIALYTLSQHENAIKETSKNYAIVGGLAVQIYATSQFKEFFRPTIDADVLVETIPFTLFKSAYGNNMGKMIKNKFDLGYHLSKGHHANIVQLMQDNYHDQKNVFLLTFTRHQAQLYARIKNKVEEKLTTDITKIKLHDLEITSEKIQTKAKININPKTTINVESFMPLLENKFGRVISKSNKYDVNIHSEFEKLRKKIINGGTSFNPKTPLPILKEIINSTYMNNSEQYGVEKDIYDFCLMKKIEGK